MYSMCPATDRGTPNQPKFNYPKRKSGYILHATRMVLSLYNAHISYTQFMVKIKICLFLLLKMYFGLNSEPVV